MKKIFVLIILLVFLFVFKYSVYGNIFHTGINENRVYSLMVTGTLASNGFQVLIFKKPFYFQGNNASWKLCHRFNKKFVDLINLGIVNSNYEYTFTADQGKYFITEHKDLQIKTYIKTENEVIYLHTFADQSGDYFIYDICDANE